MSNFVHLHVHTEYSLLDGASKLDGLIDRVVELGQTSVAITDHGVMYGIPEFYKKAVAKGVKPIIGCEVYVAPRCRLQKEYELDSKYSHLILLAKNNIGYHNLLKIVSSAFVDGYYYKPRTDFEFIQKHSEGLIVLSGCLAGSVQKFLLQNDYESAKQEALKYKEVFKEDYYLEIQDHGLPEDKIVIKGLVKLSEEIDVPLVATNDCHYLTRDDSYIQKVLMCISMGKSINDDNPLLFPTDEFYVKSCDEMSELFGSYTGAIENAVKIADKCNVTLDFESMHLPKFRLPDDVDSFDYLCKLCYDGLFMRYGNYDYKERLEYELSVIKGMKFVDYFLIVSDFVKFAKDNGIAVGPGRGSATGSIVSYCLGITDIDPMKYGLIFERFLNPSRASMPDIDIDFCVERRQEVIDYINSKYGKNSVAQIITFGTLAARAAIKDVGRVLEISYSTVESVSKHFSQKPGTTILGTLEKDDDLLNRYENDSDIKKLIDVSLKVEGMPRHGSTHAAGVVITEGSVSDYLPLSKNDDIIVTQYQKTEVEQLGLLKIDLLGLRNITVIDKTVKLIQKTNPSFRLENIPQNDKATFNMLSGGNTFGVFQLESGGMRKLLTSLKPVSIDDIIAAVSLYRPGPMDSIPKYLANRADSKKIKYKTPKLIPILESTYGCIVYQEQVMQIAREVAGYTLGHADVLRAAMSKKKYDVMENERKLFIEGAVANGVSKNVAASIFEEMSEFAKYGFNKSHAAGYAHIAYQTAYLKTHYPEMFMASLLSSVSSNTGKLKEYIAESQRLGIHIFTPDINKSHTDFYAYDGTVYYALLAVKSVGRKLADKITEERELNGPFKSYIDFLERMPLEDLNKRAIEALVKAGAFDCFGYSRRHMLSVYDKILFDVTMSKRQALDNQMSFFSEQSVNYNTTYFENVMTEFDSSKKLMYEKESLGLYLSEHPLNSFLSYYKKMKYDFIDSILSGNNKKEYFKIFGIVDKVRVVTTKQLKDMAYVTLEDVSDSIDIIVFPKLLNQYKSMIDSGAYIEVYGRISQKDEDTIQLIAQEIKFPNPETILEKNQKLYLKLKSQKDDVFGTVVNLLKSFPGDNACVLYFSDTGKSVITKGKIDVQFNIRMIEQLKSLLGPENVVIK